MPKLTAKQYEALLVLEKAGGNVEKAARGLGIGVRSFRSRMERIGANARIDPLNAYERRRYLEAVAEQRAERQAKRERNTFKPCARPCKYRAPDRSQNGCDYLIITGRSRGCQAGKDCTKFEQGERKTVAIDMNDADFYARQDLQYQTEQHT